jgi:two-component system response regulator HydG
VELLVNHFVTKFAEKNRRQVSKVTTQCMEILSSYDWPGNVRELENAMERGVILMRGDELTEQSLPLAIGKQHNDGAHDVSGSAGASLFEAEKQLILQTLEECDGNKSEASRRLGITRKTLQNKLQKYDES